jgi:hypothetical protein
VWHGIRAKAGFCSVVMLRMFTALRGARA